ncbi:MAG: CPBP family intramembrane metalloprotease [Phycisphaerae bacterium]|nr:CPBP family intramembrane metalloprotease [Phycisphaerae bacterium]
MRLSAVNVIFRKELIDILRDRRTLIAMIVVPILLYPLLMLGSVHAAVFQRDRMQQEEVRIGVPDEQAGQWLAAQIHADRSLPLDANSAEDSLENGVFIVGEDLEALVANGAVHVALIPRTDMTDRTRWEIEPWFVLCYDSAEIRSGMARTRLERVLERRRATIRGEKLATLVPAAEQSLLEPVLIPVLNIATPEKVGGSMLGHVLPLVLVLMTITGAVYPAIDLTAGERERGTLETLMVAPVPVLDLIVGKFLVVAAVALIAATLNLASIGATLHFGDVQALLAEGHEASVPMAVLPLILVAMVPFAILFSAILIAVASFARTFKEAQNYVMPVIMAALIPATAGSLPGVELRGVLIVIPVANMVLLTRELLLGHYANWPAMLLVLASTSLYAVVAVVVAARLFGQEAVLFADAGSWKTLFRRRFFVSRRWPSATHALLFVAVLFPIWFHIQGQIGARIGLSSGLILLLFGVLPIGLARYLKIELRGAFSLGGASARQWLGAFAVGLGSWAMAYELLVLQSHVLPMPAGFAQANEAFAKQLEAWPLPLLLLTLAVVPGVCEELTFRGFVLNGLRSAMRPVPAIIVTALFFAGFHFLLVRFGVTAALGLLLGLACWQARSIGPPILMHVMHNAWLFVLTGWPALAETLGVAELNGTDHLPTALVAAAAVLVASGMALLRRRGHY